MRPRTATFLLVLSALSACMTTVKKDFMPMGSSRADAIASVGYEYNGYEEPQHDSAQGDALAAQICQGWGYSKQQELEASLTCEVSNEFGHCFKSRFVRHYQCLSGPRDSK